MKSVEPQAGDSLRVSELLAGCVDELQRRGIDESRTLGEHLVAHVLGCRRLELGLTLRATARADQASRIHAGTRRLAAGEPLQYVLGEAEFMGRRFLADRRALIPRPETELLVEAVLAYTRMMACLDLVVWDVGTGSGCVAVSVALLEPRAVVLASDISLDAISLARANVELHSVGGRVKLLATDLLGAAGSVVADVVVANLPYVASETCLRLERHVRDHEPRLALDGGDDGLALIRRLVVHARDALQPGGALFLEIGHDQGDSVVMMLEQAGYQKPALTKDGAGLTRVATGVRPTFV